MLSEWGYFGVYAGVIASLQLSLSCYLRGKYDTDNSGTIEADEVRFLNITQHMPVVLKEPCYKSLSIMCLMRKFVEAMLHSFCYGCITVFFMNFIMLNMDRQYAYLVTCLMIHMACMFMCKYATNAIHVASSHNAHLLYYGCGYIPLVYVWRKPEQEYLIAVSALFLLVIYRIGRGISLPRYPSILHICRLYKLDKSTDQWELASVPTTHFGTSDPNKIEAFAQDYVDQKSDMPPACSFAQWAFACPVYEIMNTHISSSFTIGVLIGTVASLLVGRSEIFDADVVSNVSLAISVSIAAMVVLTIQSIGLYGTAENNMHNTTLAHFQPKTVASVAAMLGAAAVVIHLEPIADGDNLANLLPLWVGAGALSVNIFLTFVLSTWAKLGYTRS